ncbi:hypothetical protein D3C72_1408220 [compost metagenome]
MSQNECELTKIAFYAIIILFHNLETSFTERSIMNVTFVGFEVCGEMDYRRYELTIGFDEMPVLFEQAGSTTAHYLNQVESYLYELEENDGEHSHSVLITLHQGINPGYNLAVRQLIGDQLADIIQGQGTITEQLDLAMTKRGHASSESVLQRFLEERIDEVRASQILNRVLANSTFL